ncbi:hypothetical protein IM40_01985 [Candidatus Paracaedimonas acanthamoebae]|nr:hypothetical protein IM40_01985 [Candidatus Paracaedimonas acanthamoebae]
MKFFVRFHISIIVMLGSQAPIFATNEWMDEETWPHPSFYTAKKDVDEENSPTSLPDEVKAEFADYLSMVANEVLESSSSQSASIGQENQKEPAHSSAASKDMEDLKEDHFMRLPDDLKFYLVEKELSIEDVCSLIRVSKEGRKIFDQFRVWDSCMKRFKFDMKYPSANTIKENIVRYYLRVKLNLESDPKKIKAFMKKYEKYILNKELPFENWRYCLLISHFISGPLLLTWKAQGYGIAIEWERYHCDRYEHPVDIRMLQSLYDSWAQPGKEQYILSNLYRLCYLSFKKPLVKIEEEIHKSIHSLSDESLIKIVFYLVKRPRVTDAFPWMMQRHTNMQDRRDRLQVIGNIKNKILSILVERGKSLNDSESSPFHTLIEKAEVRGEGWAYYLKALGFKYGMLGFTKDEVKAREYILAHNIPA